MQHTSHLEATVSDKNDQIKRLEDDLKQLQDFRKEWEESSSVSLVSHLENSVRLNGLLFLHRWLLIKLFRISKIC